MDRFRYWVTAAIVLILIAYGPWMLQYLPPSLNVPGFTAF